VSFHFLFEPDPHALFRIRLSSQNEVEHAKQIVKRNLGDVAQFVVIKGDHELFGTYAGESDHYGIEGWQLAQRMFELGTRFAIATVDPDFKKSIGFQMGKIIHCMLNPNLGASEYNFYLEQFIGRVMLQSRKNLIDNDVETKIRDLFEKKLGQMKSTQFRII
jgi:hypothetical protein